jgi:hypothetical protein
MPTTALEVFPKKIISKSGREMIAYARYDGHVGIIREETETPLSDYRGRFNAE